MWDCWNLRIISIYVNCQFINCSAFQFGLWVLKFCGFWLVIAVLFPSSDLSKGLEPSKEVLGKFKEEDEFEGILKDLPKEKNFLNHLSLNLYQGFWIPDMFLKGVVSAQKNFVAQDHDIILTSCPKSGTTWLKALVFAIVNRTHKQPFASAKPAWSRAAFRRW